MKQKRRVNEIIGIVFFLTAIFLQAVSVSFALAVISGMMNCLPWGWQISPW